jgi:mRNA interferase HigB
MRILSRSTLQNFWKSHPDVEEALKTWYYEASHASWQSPIEVKSAHRNASIIANNRIVFNIRGNTYRLIVQFAMTSVSFLSDLLVLIMSMTK